MRHSRARGLGRNSEREGSFLSRSLSPRRKRGTGTSSGGRWAWAKHSGTVFVVNVFVLAVIACNTLALFWTRWDSDTTPRSAAYYINYSSGNKYVPIKTHVGYVTKRSVADAGPVAAELDLDIAPPAPRISLPTDHQQTYDEQEMLRQDQQRRERLSNARNIPPLFEHVYAITQHGCRAQWEEFADRARLAGWHANEWLVQRARRIRLSAPPIPLDPAVTALAAHAHSRGTRGALRRRVAYLDAHRRAWTSISSARAKRALIIDTHLFPRTSTVTHLAEWLDTADKVSTKRNAPWHILLLRRRTPVSVSIATSISRRLTRKDTPWGNTGLWKTRRRSTGTGASAYVISLAGARLLLRSVRAYRGSIDGEFARLKSELGDAFVVLTPCESGTGNRNMLCDTFTQDITVDKVENKFICVSRALEEKHALQRLRKSR